MPVSARGSRTVWPSITTRPRVTGRSPPTSRSSVDFPQPDGPTRHTNSLRGIGIETSVSATTRSVSRETKCFETLSISIMQSGSFLDQGRIDGLLVVPIWLQLLGIGDGLPGESQP